METLSQIIASLDIFQVVINAFPSIFKPLMEGFETIFRLVFSSLSGLVKGNPGLTSGVVVFMIVYGFYSLMQRIKKARITVRAGKS
jgi:hypothetical protein